MDYLTWLLRSNDGLWQPEDAAQAVVLRSADAAQRRGAAEGDEASAVRDRASAARLRRLRDGLLPEAAWREAARERAPVLFAQLLNTAGEAAQLRRAAQLRQGAARREADPRRTGRTGSPSVAEESEALSQKAPLSMEEISRYFERDARRYG